MVRTAQAPAVKPAEDARRPSGIDRLADWAFRPVDIASLVFLRVAFGALIVIEAYRFFANGWIGQQFIEPDFHFTYYGFDWVQPWPGNGMFIHFAVLGVLGALIMTGTFYRVAAALFFLGFSYVFLLEQARYLNHFYLLILFAFLMIFVPAHRSLSIDTVRRPGLYSPTVPAWSLWILRIQMGLVYLFSGVAKINSEWLNARPLRDFLATQTDFPVIGGFFTEDWLVFLFVWGALLIDLLAFPLLLWRRTRLLMFAGLTVFHLMNAALFHIGIFPYLAIAATTLFLEPDWPRRVLARFRQPERRTRRRKRVERRAVAQPPRPRRKLTVGLLGAYLAVQVLVPLRHFAYPGEVSWTEEGHRFSWHMMLRNKDARARFYVTYPDLGTTFELDPNMLLPKWQYNEMAKRPHLILQYAHYLAERFREPGGPRPEVRAHVVASLNNGPGQMLIDPRVDLARVGPSIPPAEWIVPLGSDRWIPPPVVAEGGG